MAASTVRIEPLNKENYDTWRIQMEALLVKNDLWGYANGTKVKPEIIPADPISRTTAEKWENEDRKARADVILCIKPSELKQIKGCETARQVWLKLQEIYQSKGPARKATLLKRLTLHKMVENEDIHEHLSRFFDTVDKLGEMEIQINPDLLTIMLLYSLPPSYENFRCAIESRDELPSAETLKIKIIEENDARKGDERSNTSNAMFIKRRTDKRRIEKPGNWQKPEGFKYKCHRCRKVGHKAVDCRENQKTNDKTNRVDDVLLYAVEDNACAAKDCDRAESVNVRDERWCLDSGCTAHLCNNEEKFTNVTDERCGTLCLANSDTTQIRAKGTVSCLTKANGNTRNVTINDALYVPDLRTNLLSVAKITDRGLKVLFDNKTAKIVDKANRVMLTCDRKDGLYFLREKDIRENANSAENGEHDSRLNLTQLWHRRMGHLNFRDLTDIYKNKRVRGMILKDRDDIRDCETCQLGKMSKCPFPKTFDRSTEPLKIIHSDVCGPMRIESNGNAKYFITFIDDHSGWCEIRMMKGKHQVL